MLNISRENWFQFVKNYISDGKEYKMKIVGTSMLPTFHPDDSIVIKKKEIEDLEIGDIILFFSEQKYFIIHRLIKKKRIGNELFLITKGDNNHFVDKYKINKNNYIGICKCI